MTTKELETMLTNVPAEAMQAFIARGMLLAEVNSVDSKIANVRVAQAEYNKQVESQIDELNAVRTALQDKVNAL